MLKLQKIYERLSTRELIKHHYGENFNRWFNDSQIVNDKGMPLRVYHQTNASNVSSINKDGFDISKGKARLGDPYVPDGIFFKPDGKDIGLGGRNSEQIGVYLSIQNPLEVTDVKELVYRISGLNNEYGKLYYAMRKQDDAYDKAIEKLNSEVTRETISTYQEETAKIFKVWRQWYKDEAKKLRSLVTDTLVENGYDGVIIERDEGSMGRVTKTIIALYPNQVKKSSANNFDLDSNSIEEQQL